MKHGICKEYDSSGKLIFEGEYLNGLKWNGKGYKNDILEFEIKKGSGKIKKYFNDKLIFEGEYLNGKGKEFNCDLFHYFLEYEVEYLNDKTN